MKGNQMSDRLILHDLQQAQAEGIIPRGYETFDALPSVKPCVGCFGCWVKTPGQCVINDRGRGFLKHMANCSELIIISRCVFGGLSPDVKAVIDRSIGYILPYFRIMHDEMHHVPRYEKSIKLDYMLYGDINEAERETARMLVKGNAINFNASRYDVRFFTSADEIMEVL